MVDMLKVDYFKWGEYFEGLLQRIRLHERGGKLKL